MTDKTIMVVGEEIRITFPYSLGLVSRVKQLYNRRWNAEGKYWALPVSPMYAKIALDFGNQHNFILDGKLLDLLEQSCDRIIRSDRTKLYPFQREAVDFIHQSGGNCLLADSCGLGKTLEALWYIKENPKIQLVLIVSPANVIYKWQNEITRWLGWDSVVLQSGKQELPECNIWIMSYDMLWRTIHKFSDKQFDLVILDEVHAISHHKTKRSVAAERLKAKHKLLLSGTPFLNRPSELWHVLHVLQPFVWTSFWAFANKYCAAKKVKMGRRSFWDTSGASNIPELKERLKELMIRRTKQEVLLDLPELTRTIMPIDIKTTDYYKAFTDFRKWLLEQSKVTVSSNALVKLNYLRQIIGMEKADEAIDLAKELLESDIERKVIIYAHHRAVVDKIVKACYNMGYNAETIVGGDSPMKRAETIRKFQDKLLPRVLVISQAGGEGIDLFRADAIVFAEREWNSGKEEQVEGRLHRIGQTNPVNAYYLVAKNTIDEKINDLINDKRFIFDAIVGGQNIEQIIIEGLVSGDLG